MLAFLNVNNHVTSHENGVEMTVIQMLTDLYTFYKEPKDTFNFIT